MNRSFKAIAAAALLAVASLPSHAAQWNVSWDAMLTRTTWDGNTTYTPDNAPASWHVTGVVEGVLQNDNNTVLVSDVISWKIAGDTLVSSDFASGGVGSVTNYYANGDWSDNAVLTLNGSDIDFSAGSSNTLNYIQFGFGTTVDFSFYGTGSSHEYFSDNNLTLPLTNWSMSQVSAPSAPVPEPSTALLLLAGLPLLARRRKVA